MTFDDLELDERGLVPAVVQDADGGAVLMVGYMNAESLKRTIETGEVHFYSRSRGKLWRKGETSGNVLRLVEIAKDCDRDCLLVRAEPTGPTCHTGARSCFLAGDERPGPELSDALGRLARVIRERNRDRPAGSYTTELFTRGVARVAQKVGEEATEVVIAAMEQDGEALAKESADLLYHMLVLWEAAGISPGDVAAILEARRGAKP